MFGYIEIDKKTLGKEEIDRYQATYCGLCLKLGERFGSEGRNSLTFDMTFLALLLSSLYDLPDTVGRQHCVRRPLHSHPYVVNPATEYAADMNIVLAYHQALDDLNDDHSIIAWRKSRLLKKFLPEVIRQYPRQCGVIISSLKQLSKIEASGELNPDIPANCFGRILGEVFIWRKDEYSETLQEMGAALGRFIYLLDAANDLRSDLKKQRYNPLAAQLDTDFLPALTMLMGECTSEFEKLPLKRDLHILRNILYSGVWTKYKTNKEAW